MESSQVKVRSKLKQLWPKLRHIWLFDRLYYNPTLEELQQFLYWAKAQKIAEISYNDMYNVGDVFDCDDFSVVAAALSKIYVKHNFKGTLPWSFGVTMGNEFRGMPILHSLNICLTTEGIYLLDYGDRGRLWKAAPENDSVFFVFI